MTLQAENEIVEGIAEILYAGRDEASAETAVEIAFAGGFSQVKAWFRTAYDGDWQPTAAYADRSPELVSLFAGLRRLMYRPDTGTWFSARLTVTAQGDYRSDYDYENQPRFDPPVDPALFAEDLRAFPRDSSHLPAWASAGA